MLHNQKMFSFYRAVDKYSQKTEEHLNKVLFNIAYFLFLAPCPGLLDIQ